MSNKISTKSYFIKRLRDCGYSVDKLDSINYSETDERKWSAIIDSGGMNIIATCYRDGLLHLYDGGRYLDTELKIQVESIESLVEYLNKVGLVHKHPSYGR